MSNQPRKTASLWMAQNDLPSKPPLANNLDCDVCIVGAGIAGLTTAYLLAGEGRRVVVLEKGELVSGETSRTTAHLAFVIDDGFAEIERLHGQHGLRLHVESHKAAVERIQQIVREENIECDFTRLDGYLFAPDGRDADYIRKEREAAQRAGISDVEVVQRLPLHFHTGPALRFGGQAQFHVLKYLSGLIAALERRDCQIFAHTRVEPVQDGEPVQVSTSGSHVVRCTAAVVATNSPINDVVAIHSKQAPYRTYVVGARIPKGSMPLALYWDTEDPYHYVRLQPEPDHDVLIVGGEDHKTGQGEPERSFQKLERWTRERFPQVSSFDYRWSGQVMEPADGIAFIGRNPMDKHVYVATGDSGMGMTHGTIAGMLLTDLIQGRSNTWADLYDPSRKTLRSVPEYAKENLNVAARYADWITPGEVRSAEHISPAEGAVLRSGGLKVAAYRDPAGALHTHSAVCTHLGCIVRWNSIEESWDCPCHGSRFDPYGQVLNGPAVRDLAPVSLPDRAQPEMPAAVMRNDIFYGALAGALGGIAGTFAMYAAQRVVNPREPRAARELANRGGRFDTAALRRKARFTRQDQRDATVLAARSLAKTANVKLSPREEQFAGMALHYLFGAGVGALYGAAAERFPAVRKGLGVPFGLGVWLAGAEAALPLLGLTRSPRDYPFRDHIKAAGLHAVFGMTTELVRSAARKQKKRDFELSVKASPRPTIPASRTA